MGADDSWHYGNFIDKIYIEVNSNIGNYANILHTSFDYKDCWNFYSNKDINLENAFDSEDNSKEFIKRFIKLAEKAETNALFEKIDNLGIRATHIVCTFFLGIYLYEKNERIKEAIDAEICRLKKKYKFTSDVQFSYIWFLICLFHDLGYDYENNPDAYRDFEDFFKKVKYLRDLGKGEGVPKLYEHVYKKYFNYRLESMKVDHGICAAFILYRDLCKIRNEQHSSDEPKSILSWEPQLDKVYNYASWIILAHNIWFVREKDKCGAKCYESKKLKKLILKENDGVPKYSISLKKHPFLFLFCLVDSIEPFKIVKEVSLLNKIIIEVKSGEIILESNLNCGCHDFLLNKAEDLNNWLTKSKIVENKVIITVC